VLKLDYEIPTLSIYQTPGRKGDSCSLTFGSGRPIVYFTLYQDCLSYSGAGPWGYMTLSKSVPEYVSSMRMGCPSWNQMQSQSSQ